MRGERFAPIKQQVITKQVELAFGDDTRIQHFQGSRRGIARIGK